jgi:HEAT repeat protein
MRPRATWIKRIKRNRGQGALLAVVLLLSWSSGAAPVGAAAPLSSAGPVVAGLVAEARDRSRDPAERIRSIGVLGNWATAEVREPLIELLKDPAAEIRAAAAKGLGWGGNSPALTALKERVTDKTEQGAVRVAAVGAVVRIGDPAGRATVLEASRDADPQVREEALRGLVGGGMESPSDRVALAKRAIEDGALSAPFRSDAIRVLTASGDPAVIPILVKVLETGPRVKIAPPPPNATEQQMLAGRYQQIGDMRAWAARGLGELGARSEWRKLVAATEDPDDFFLRYVAAGALVSWRAREGLPALLKLLDDPTSEVRTVAVVGVGAVGDQSNVDALAARLSDNAIGVRVAAVEALAAIGGAKARQRLQAAQATEAHPQVKQALETALARLRRDLSAIDPRQEALRTALGSRREEGAV